MRFGLDGGGDDGRGQLRTYLCLRWCAAASMNQSMPMIRYGTWCGDKIARNDGRCCTATEDQCSLEKELQCTRGMVDCMRNSAWVPPGNRVLSFPAGKCMINARRTWHS